MLLCPLATAFGCYASHTVVFDGGPRPDGPDTDARVGDGEADTAARDGGPDASDERPSCARPFTEWGTFVERVLPGRWARGAARMRDGERTWLAVYSPETSQTHILEMSFDGQVPVIARNWPVGAGVPIAAAMDSVHIAIALEGLETVPTVLLIFDSGVRMLAMGLSMNGGGRATVALRSGRVALARAAAFGFFSSVELFDTIDGRLVRGESFAEYSEVAVGLGLGLFNVLATPPGGGESELFGLDEAGLTNAGPIGRRMVAVEWDGLVAVGVDPDRHQLLIRRPRVGVTVLPGAPRITESAQPSIATLGSEVWVAFWDSDTGRIGMTDGSNTFLHPLEGARPPIALFAHADATHRGVFVLTERDLRWVGVACDR